MAGQMFIMGGGQVHQIKTCQLSVENTGESYIMNVDDKRVDESIHRATYKEVLEDIRQVSESKKYGFAVTALQINPPRKVYKNVPQN